VSEELIRGREGVHRPRGTPARRMGRCVLDLVVWSELE
jgi:hypothetical protein